MKYILLAVLLLYINTSFAQTEIIITGQVYDESTQEPLPYSNVSVLTRDNDIVTGTISDDFGVFVIRGIDQGDYTIKISNLGNETFLKNILIGELNKNYDLGKIYLKPSLTNLDEVTITAQKQEVSKNLDKKTFNLDNNIAQSGGSIMDAMKAMPSVSFDQNGKVILRGSDKVIVLIDGKQSSLTGFGNQKGLDNIPASNIERIEIINNPSAKYDANGMVGIINIVYKKNKQEGVNGSIGFNYGLGALSKRRADLPTDLGSFSPTPKYIPSLDLSYKKNKIETFFQSEILFQEKLPNNEFTTRFYNNGDIIASQVAENREQTHYILKGGINYNIDTKNSISFSGIYDWESHVDTSQVAYINELTKQRNRYITWNEEEITGFINFILNYKHKFNQAGHYIETSVQYSKAWEDETYFINDSSSVRTNGRDITSVLGTEHTTSIKVDYVKPLSSGRLESGVKIQSRNLPVDYEQIRGDNSILYSGLGTFSKWKEDIYAGYLGWIHEKEKYSIEGGLRAEYTNVKYSIDPNNTYYNKNDAYDYFRLFPNVRVSYKFNPKNSISIFYNQRVDRPGEPQLRIYPKSDDQELVKVGNPYLRPQFTNSGEIGYKTKWSSGSLYLAGYYRNIEDPYRRVFTEDETITEYDVVLKSYANTGRATNTGLELVFNQNISDFWKLSGNMNIYENKIFDFTGTLLFPNEHTFTIDKSADTVFEGKLINTFTLPNDFRLQVTGIYIGPRNIPQGKAFERSSIDFGLNKKLWEKKMEFNLAVTDIFNRYGIKEENDGNGFSSLYQNYFETQTIRAGVNYKF
ncbi:MAG: TonB-dependent receptor domain-containing protein [Jejuia sp.]